MATYEQGKWYSKADFAGLRQWCKDNSKPFFAFRTNEAGNCSFCINWRDSCLGKAEFTEWMRNSRLYYCKIEAGTDVYAEFTNAIKTDCKTTSVATGFPFGYFYKNEKFNEYFSQPVSKNNIHHSSTKSTAGRPTAFIGSSSELIALLKQYESAELVTVTFKDWDNSILKTQEVEKGKNATPPTDPSREKYVFTGWSGSYTNVQANTTCTAQYKQVQPETDQGKLIIDTSCFGAKHDVIFQCNDGKLVYYLYPENWLVDTLANKVLFDGNGATSGKQENINTTLRQSWTCPQPTISKTGYVFDSWNSKKDGTGKSYVSGISYSALRENLTLYAQWKLSRKIYAVIATYDANESKQDAYDWGLSDANNISQMLSQAYGDSIIIKKLVQTDKPTATKVLNAIEDYMNQADCQILFIYLGAHGSRSNNRSRMIYAGDSKLYGDTLFNKLKNATCKVHLVVQCCHAAQFVKAVNPFSSSKTSKNEITAQNLDIEETQIDNEVYNMPADFILDAKKVFNTSYGTKNILKSTNAQADPCLLVWTCCDGDEYGWSCSTSEKIEDPVWFAAMSNKIGGGLGLSFVDQFKTGITYSSFWKNMTADGQYCRLNQCYHTSLPKKYPISTYGKGPTPQQAVFGNFDVNSIVFT